MNRGGKPIDVRLAAFRDPSPGPLVLWQPATGAKRIDLPLRLVIPADQAATVTEEDTLDRLAKLPRWNPPAGSAQEQVVFDFRSASDLEGWKLEGDAFSVCPLPGLCSRPTLNSYGKAGESAVGTAVSPPLAIAPELSRLRLLYHGGISQSDGGRENLSIRFVDASTGRLLDEILPPGTHVLTVREHPLDKLRGKRVRIEIVDRNTSASYAWIGLARLSFLRHDPKP